MKVNKMTIEKTGANEYSLVMNLKRVIYYNTEIKTLNFLKDDVTLISMEASKSFKWSIFSNSNILLEVVNSANILSIRKSVTIDKNTDLSSIIQSLRDFELLVNSNVYPNFCWGPEKRRIELTTDTSRGEIPSYSLVVDNAAMLTYFPEFSILRYTTEEVYNSDGYTDIFFKNISYALSCKLLENSNELIWHILSQETNMHMDDICRFKLNRDELEKVYYRELMNFISITNMRGKSDYYKYKDKINDAYKS